ncbi:hypothetical protein KUCAC02_007100, partial [Chaenocephalus aceratus]
EQSLLSQYASLLSINPQLALTEMTMVFAKCNRITSRNLEADFFEALDQHTPRFIQLFKERIGGTETAEHQLAGTEAQTRALVNRGQRMTCSQERGAETPPTGTGTDGGGHGSHMAGRSGEIRENGVVREILRKMKKLYEYLLKMSAAQHLLVHQPPLDV